MERFKNLLLMLLVVLSLYLTYNIMYVDDYKDQDIVPVDKLNVISYKRFYKISPARESFDEIPNNQLSEILADSLVNGKEIYKIDTEGLKDEKKNPDMFPFYALPDFNNGYLVVSGFDIPLKLLFLSTGRETKKMPFETVKKFHINNQSKRIYVYTENGLFETQLNKEYEIDNFNRYISLDEDYLPEGSVGINNFAVIENPMDYYKKKDRTSIAEQFLGEKNAFEIEDERNYTYSSETASVTLGKDGNISYLKSPPNDASVVTIYDSLVALKNFVKNSPLTFSTYRIIKIENLGDEEYKICLTSGKQPSYSDGKGVYEATFKRNKIIKFNYNSMYVKEYEQIFRKPSLSEYREAIKKGEDPILYYRGSSGVGILHTGK